MNTRVSRIARRQARLDGFVESPSPPPPPPPPEASEDDDNSDNDNDDESSFGCLLDAFTLCHS